MRSLPSTRRLFFRERRFASPLEFARRQVTGRTCRTVRLPTIDRQQEARIPLSEETIRRLREARERDEASGISQEEAHADLPLLPPLPTAPDQVVMVSYPRRKRPSETAEEEADEASD